MALPLLYIFLFIKYDFMVIKNKGLVPREIFIVY